MWIEKHTRRVRRRQAASVALEMRDRNRGFIAPASKPVIHVTAMVRSHACVLMVLLSLTMASAAGTTDFSGSYTLTAAKHASKSLKDVFETLTVVQTANAVEVTRMVDGKSISNKFPLDGKEGIYYTENQTRGTCKGHMKGNQLFLDATVTIRLLGDVPPVILYFEERWQLSPDPRTLKIHREVVAPLSPIGIEDPSTDLYTRN